MFQASLVEWLPVCTHLAEIVATFSIQAMIWPPKVLTWWFVCGGSTSSTLSTLVCSAGTASWYSWHSPGSAKTRRWHQPPASPSASCGACAACTRLSRAAAQQVCNDLSVEEPHPPPLCGQAVLHLLQLCVRNDLLQLHLCTHTHTHIKKTNKGALRRFLFGTGVQPYCVHRHLPYRRLFAWQQR